MRKTIFFLSLFIIGGAIVSFLILSSGCRKKISIVVPNGIDISVNKIDSFNYDTIAQNDTIEYDSFACAFKIEIEIISQLQIPKFTNEAFASKIFRYYTFGEKISTIKIFSLENYNSEIIAGSECSDSCGYFMLDYAQGSTYNNKEEILTEINTKSLPFQYFRFFKPLSPPDQLSKQQFAIEIITENGTTFSDTSNVFYLKP